VVRRYRLASTKYDLRLVRCRHVPLAPHCPPIPFHVVSPIKQASQTKTRSFFNTGVTVYFLAFRALNKVRPGLRNPDTLEDERMCMHATQAYREAHQIQQQMYSN
jgi:hypothetical protein